MHPFYHVSTQERALDFPTHLVQNKTEIYSVYLKCIADYIHYTIIEECRVLDFGRNRLKPSIYPCVCCVFRRRLISSSIRRRQAGRQQGVKQSFPDQPHTPDEFIAAFRVQIRLHICRYETVQSGRGWIICSRDVPDTG